MKKVLICLAGCLLLAAQAILAQEVEREWDNRWFISPLCKFQVQEFGMLEKNRHGFLSDANQLPIMDKINASFAASAYKNIVGRLSFSVDIGLSYGHVTSKDRLISTTEAQTYNLLNATLYYHLLSHRYRLQPFISAGITNLINDSSYTSAPMGVGLKFNSKKIMIMAQAAYGYSISKTTANSLNYSLGLYLGINNKKKKKADKDKAAAADSAKKAQEDLAKKSDTTNKNNGQVVNNIVINVNVDSLLTARAGNNNGANGNQNGWPNNGNPNGNPNEWQGRENGKADYGDSLAGGRTAQAFDLIDYQVDTINGKPALKFTVYFYYKDYSLTSRAFATVDKVIAQLKRNPGKIVEIKGYTDNVGSTEYNNYLSMRRAQMAFDYMNSRGVPAERMIVSYYGKEYPVAENTPANAWLNRRVELVVRDKD
ncbi:OmpA family protein [Pseudoflavitalea sp. X16]|uniref:OmpA family protein n=1 Tax=Paraflavitalea devenefica TaxID=2716334 RepID=UPI00141EC1AC|nr:OmpA family protein [Paraflavitalea devenefica]NII29652.1 OmpA family protein [Paraflavitalea devenefica]